MCRQIASVAVRILGGETPGNIKAPPIGSGTPKYDWRELQRWNISESQLPRGSEVLFRVPSVWEHYRPQLTAGLAAILLQAGIIALLLVERRRPEASKPRHEVVRLNRVTTATVLSSSIAHELNQPLGAILCNTEAARMLLKADPPDLAQLGEIRPIAAPLPDMEGSLWLLTHPDLRKVARIRTVLDFMADALSRQRDLIEGRHRKSAAPEPNCHSLVKS